MSSLEEDGFFAPFGVPCSFVQAKVNEHPTSALSQTDRLVYGQKTLVHVIPVP